MSGGMHVLALQNGLSENNTANQMPVEGGIVSEMASIWACGVQPGRIRNVVRIAA
jgi:hypothetical protein